MVSGRRFAVLAWATCSVLTAASADARAQVRELRWDPPVDLAVTLVGGALWLASVALQPEIAPSRCSWCLAGGMDGSVRNALLWRNPGVADDISNVGAFVLVPAATFGLDAAAAVHDHASRGFSVDALLVLEATVLALDANQITKLLVARERPYVHARSPDQKLPRLPTDDDNVSFFSGHTTETFALAAATGTVATMRGYRWAPVPWIVGGSLAAGTGYLRIAADRHWLTDVLVGVLVGVGIGVAVPLLFHGPTGG
jgi:membrane-associated phospholipid phosphatase